MPKGSIYISAIARAGIWPQCGRFGPLSLIHAIHMRQFAGARQTTAYNTFCRIADAAGGTAASDRRCAEEAGGVSNPACSLLERVTRLVFKLCP